VFQFTDDSPKEIADQITTTHETEQVTLIFYSQQEVLKVEVQFEFFDKFDTIKDEKDKPIAEKLQALFKSEEIYAPERYPQNQFSCPRMKCKRVLTSEKRLNQHILNHEYAPQFKCDSCDKTSVSKND
jgi:hypothetical protein